MEGLGFYIDRSTRVNRAETGVSDTGYLAPFAFYRLVLFDLAANKVIAQEDARSSKAYPIASTGETDAWNVLTAEQKFDELERRLTDSAGRALSRLLAGRARG